MATISEIKFKRSKTAGKKPAVASLKEGELAINLVDKKLFTNTGDKIEDLTLRSGGKVDGALEVIGKVKSNSIESDTGTIKELTSTNITVSNELTVGMDLKAKRNVIVDGSVQAGTELRSNNGVVRARARAAANSHIWFEGEEVGNVNGRNYERGVFYALPQTETSGSINLRVMNGTKEGQGNATFGFGGDGRITNFTALVGHQLVSRNKPSTGGSNAVYTIDNRVDTTGEINYMRAYRANAQGTIFHELCDSRTGSEIATYTGQTAQVKIQALKDDGRQWLRHSIMLGGDSNQTSGLGFGSIALGDNDTGLRWVRDGEFDVMNNSRISVKFTSYAPHRMQVHKGALIKYTDNDDAEVLAPDRSALLQINTNIDGNNFSGNGLTLIGYNENGKYHHYFRGKGTFNINNDNGLVVTRDTDLQSALNVRGQTTAQGRINSLGGIQMTNDTMMEWARNTDFARISFKNTGDDDSDSYMKLVSGDNGNEYFKFVSVAGSTERPLFDIRYGDNFSHYKLGIGGSRNTFGSNNSISLGWGQTGFVAESSGVLTAFANGQWITKSRDDGSVEINGNRHAATHPHQWTNQYGQMAPVHINTGVVSGASDYYPAVRHVTQASGYGYRTALDFGTLRENNGGFGVGIIRVATDERTPADNQSAIFKLNINGSFTAPGIVYCYQVSPSNFSNFDARYQLKATSDENLKTDINDFDGARSLENIEKMKFKTFEYLDSPGVERRGLIAQEAQLIDSEYTTVVTSTVGEDDDITVKEHLALDTNPLLMDALAAIQVLSAQVKELQSQLAGK
ncbi:tail fiber domain-containing protein [Enterobacter cloacae]|uniref:tail fiber domain-containing protein n=1 Tax=Enterobacter cloacae TaxID=550 RepID=UPI0024E0183B|nr:tail fiber domain-containing protein [Enterobacter cloacae]MDK2708828.1 tail fiber domain-containing protein [Enterobacter cloacae]